MGTGTHWLARSVRPGDRLNVLGPLGNGFAISSTKPLAALIAAEPGATVDARRKPDSDNPKLPRVMIIGDSISVGYTDGAREELAGKANVYRVQGNAGPSPSFRLMSG